MSMLSLEHKWTAGDFNGLPHGGNRYEIIDGEKKVDQYWIVDLDSRVIERSVPTDARPETLSETLEWQPADTSTPFVLDLVEYFSAVLDD